MGLVRVAVSTARARARRRRRLDDENSTRERKRGRGREIHRASLRPSSIYARTRRHHDASSIVVGSERPASALTEKVSTRAADGRSTEGEERRETGIMTSRRRDRAETNETNETTHTTYATYATHGMMDGMTEDGGSRAARCGGVANADGYRWRKYGQKNIKGSRHPRSYYRCTERGCPARKKTELVDGARNETARRGGAETGDDGTTGPKTPVLRVTYEGEHTHEKPTEVKANGTTTTTTTTTTTMTTIPVIVTPEKRGRERESDFGRDGGLSRSFVDEEGDEEERRGKTPTRRKRAKIDDGGEETRTPTKKIVATVESRSSATKPKRTTPPSRRRRGPERERRESSCSAAKATSDAGRDARRAPTSPVARDIFSCFDDYVDRTRAWERQRELRYDFDPLAAPDERARREFYDGVLTKVPDDDARRRRLSTARSLAAFDVAPSPTWPFGEIDLETRLRELTEDASAERLPMSPPPPVSRDADAHRGRRERRPPALCVSRDTAVASTGFTSPRASESWFGGYLRSPSIIDSIVAGSPLLASFTRNVRSWCESPSFAALSPLPRGVLDGFARPSTEASGHL
jgi:hypothetical protein